MRSQAHSLAAVGRNIITEKLNCWTEKLNWPIVRPAYPTEKLIR